MKRKKWAAVIILGMAVAAAAGIFILKREKQVNKIGVVMWNGEQELYQAVDTYTNELERILETDIELIKCNSSAYMDYEEILKDFRRRGGKVLINVLIQDIPELQQACEKNKIHFLQMWEMPTDTDVVDRMNESPYFLGYMTNDEQQACQDMAQAMKAAGCKNTAVMVCNYGNLPNNVHHLRGEEFIRGLEPGQERVLLEIADFEEGMRYLKDMENPVDGVLSSIGMFYDTAENIAESMDSPELKFAHFDADSYTGEDLESGRAVMISCGQQNIFALSVIYASAYIKGEITREERIALTCPYLEITSAEEYELYREQCVEKLLYSSDEIKKLEKSLEKDNSLLTDYALDYDISWLNGRKSE